MLLAKRLGALFLILSMLVGLFSGCTTDPDSDVSQTVSGEFSDLEYSNPESTEESFDGSEEDSENSSDDTSENTENSGSGENGTTEKNDSNDATGNKTDSKVTSTTSKPGTVTEASAILGKTKKLSGLTLTTPSGSDYSFSERGGREGWMMTGKSTVLSIKLSDAFIKYAAGKELIVFFEFYGDANGSFFVTYAQGNKTAKEAVYTERTNSWIGGAARLKNIKYGGIDKQDIQIVFNDITMLRIASIRVVASNNKSVEGTGMVKETNLAFNTPHVVKTTYATEEAVVADATVTYFGAAGDGVTDDTAAFEAAIRYVAKKGGGTVFIPEGKYVIKSALNVPNGVSLRGDLKTPDGKSAIKGTVLMSYVGKGTTDFDYDTPFINLGKDSELRGVAIWYPEQTLAGGKATPYSWSVKLDWGATAEDIVLVNSYRGIQIGPEAGLVTTVRNVWGTPLEHGIFIDRSVDIARFQNVNFTADYWLNSGLGKAPSKTALASWLISEATAFLYERVDWTYFWDFTIDGYKIGLHGRNSTNQGEGGAEPGNAGGQIYNVKITNCNVCLLIDAITGRGANLSSSTLSAAGGSNPVAVKLNEGFDVSYMFNNCTLKSTGKNVLVSNGSGAVTLTDCTISGGSRATNLVDMSKTGQFSSTNTTYSGGTNHVRLASGVSAANLVNNMTKATFKLKDETSGKKTTLVYDSSTAAPSLKEIADKEYDITYVTKPNAMQLMDVSQAPYNIAPTANGKGEDISAALQKALDAMAKAGGGIVYVPAGEYRLDKSITVPSGVELRGASDNMLHYDYAGTTFYTDYARLKMDATPLIILQENSGVYGFRVYHDKSVYNNPLRYPFVIQGRGSDCYVINVMLANAYQGVDFATYKCDRHFIMGVFGMTFKVGIQVGGGSKDGVVRDCQFNPNSLASTKYDGGTGAGYGDVISAVSQRVLKSNDAFIVEDSVNEVLYTNFVYGTWHGFTLRDNADVFMMGNAVDGSGMSLQIEDIVKDKTTWIVASQLCVCLGINNEAYVKTTDEFAGKVNLIQGLGFGSPPAAITLNGTGTFNLVNFHFEYVYKTANASLTINNKNGMVVGCCFRDGNPTYDILIGSDVNNYMLYGNLFAHGKNARIKNNAGTNVSGSDLN